MSTLDEIISNGLADWRKKQAEEEAERVAEKSEREKANRELFQRVIKLLLNIDAPPFGVVMLDDYAISYSSHRSNEVTLYITKGDLPFDGNFRFGGTVWTKGGDVSLGDRDYFLLNLERAKQAVDEAIAKPPIPPPPPEPKVKLDADGLNAIWFCKGLIDALETGWALTEKQRYVMATIRYTNAIERWTRNDDE